MNDFITVIEDLTELFQELIQIEQLKLEAAKKNRITHVEESMNKEQAAILKLRGLDRKRELCQEALGFKGLTFQEILSKTSGEEHEQLKNQFNTLSHYVRLFQNINDSARTMIEINLHKINNVISNATNKTASDKR
ncbi:flagellar export chaperone FlgN [Lacrimispora sp. JR3]|uniref:flagellar export chaperone FlgN n=1 Tax=Lacrimispora sinapis TaxID=3111456 RepID=UPI003749A5CC